MTTAYEVGNGHCETFKAAADLSAAQYHFVKLNATGGIVLCDSADDVPIGVLQDDPAGGQDGNVMLSGTTKLEVERGAAGTAVAIGDRIGTGGNGRADTKAFAAAANAATNTASVVGRALTAAPASANRRLIAAFINCATPVPAAS